MKQKRCTPEKQMQSRFEKLSGSYKRTDHHKERCILKNFEMKVGFFHNGEIGDWVIKRASGRENSKVA